MPRRTPSTPRKTPFQLSESSGQLPADLCTCSGTGWVASVSNMGPVKVKCLHLWAEIEADQRAAAGKSAVSPTTNYHGHGAGNL